MSHFYCLNCKTRGHLSDHGLRDQLAAVEKERDEAREKARVIFSQASDSDNRALQYLMDCNAAIARAEQAEAEVERLKTKWSEDLDRESAREAGEVMTYAGRLYRAAHVVGHRHHFTLPLVIYIEDLREVLDTVPESVKRAAEKE